MKKITLYLLIALVGIVSSGWATTTRTAYGFGSGVVKDTKDTTNAIIKADQWFRENLW